MAKVVFDILEIDRIITIDIKNISEYTDDKAIFASVDWDFEIMIGNNIDLFGSAETDINKVREILEKAVKFNIIDRIKEELGEYTPDYESEEKQRFDIDSIESLCECAEEISKRSVMPVNAIRLHEGAFEECIFEQSYLANKKWKDLTQKERLKLFKSFSEIVDFSEMAQEGHHILEFNVVADDEVGIWARIPCITRNDSLFHDESKCYVIIEDDAKFKFVNS